MTSHLVESHKNAHLLLFDAENDGEKLIADLIQWAQQKFMIKKERSFVFMDQRDDLIRKIFLEHAEESNVRVAGNADEVDFLDWFNKVANRDSLICYRTPNSAQKVKQLEAHGVIQHRTASLTSNNTLSKRRSMEIETELPVALSPIQNTTHLSVGDNSFVGSNGIPKKELSPRNRLSGSNILSPVKALELSPSKHPNTSPKSSPSTSPQNQSQNIAISPRPAKEAIMQLTSNPQDRKVSPSKLESLNLKKRPRLRIEEDIMLVDDMQIEPLPAHKKLLLQPIERKVKKRKTKSTTNISPHHAANDSPPKTVKLNSIGASPKSKSNPSLRLPPLG